MWERACSRMQSVSHWKGRLIHCIREQARSHICFVYAGLTYFSFAAVTCDEANFARQDHANPGPVAQRPGLAYRILRRP
ncbi:hypothetical protein DYL59_04010 [Pseudomonas kairouanensis]|uniref:Uncharacterized protein n=1 Tax=Pseudomonas kairouanensis TaxID=2293832 RepID=A0A4Z0AY31_9PSED|nr:hypothetical protein DYL59_04010 [Pseudomonas kairouanensis]